MAHGCCRPIADGRDWPNGKGRHRPSRPILDRQVRSLSIATRCTAIQTDRMISEEQIDGNPKIRSVSSPTEEINR